MNSVEESMREYAAMLDRASTALVADALTYGSAASPRDPGRRRVRLVLVVVGALVLGAVVIAVAVVPSRDTEPGRVAVGRAPSSETPASVFEGCPRTAFDPRGSSDGLPYANMVTKAAVDAVIAQSGFRIVARYSATDLSESPVDSNAIATLSDGTTAITSGTIYVINVSLASATSCPRAPAFYDGVPLIFRIRTRQANAAGTTTTTVVDACDVGRSTTFTAWDHATNRAVEVNRAYYCQRVADLTPTPDSHLSANVWIANGKVMVEYHRVTEVTKIDARGRSVGTAVESKKPVPIDQLPISLQDALRKT